MEFRRFLSCRPGLGEGQRREPCAYYEANNLGCIHLLEICRKLEIGRFILASTSSVHGSGADGPVGENMELSRPLPPYAASKKAADTLLHSYHHLYGIDAVAERLTARVMAAAPMTTS